MPDLKITRVNNCPIDPHTRAGKKLTISSVEVQVDNTGELIVEGKGFSKGPLYCTLVCLCEKEVTVRRTTRVIWKPKKDDTWNVMFQVKEAGASLLSCHSVADGNAHAEVIIKEVPRARFELALTTYHFTAAQIWATGTVFNAYNPVTCTLTHVDCSTGVATGAPQQAGATFNNATTWGVSFAPLGGGNFSGCYLLEATAASEGTVSTGGNIP